MNQRALDYLMRQAEQARDRLASELASIDRNIAGLQRRYDGLDETLAAEMSAAMTIEGGFGLLADYMTGRERKKSELKAAIEQLQEARQPLEQELLTHHIEVKKYEKLKAMLDARQRALEHRQETLESEEAARRTFLSQK